MQAMPRKDCTFIVNSCDAQSDIWLPFFLCLEKYWPEMNWPIVLNTESKTYKYKNYDIKTFRLFEGKKDKWSQRLKETLKQIKTKYIFFMLDDFFIVEPVDTKFINQCFKWMDENPKIAVFSFHPVIDDNNMPSSKYKGFEKRPKHGNYMLNCQAAIWRRDRLIKFLKNAESPWDFEVYGSIRVSGFHDDFYTLLPKHKHPIEYNMRKGGTGLVRGMWSKSVVVPLFKELGIKVDFNKRGFAPEDYFDTDTRSTTTKIRNNLSRKARTSRAKIQAKIASITDK
jgi:hypothetical protein